MAIQFITPEFYRYIEQSRHPVAIKVIEGRYLFIQFVELTESDATFFPPAGGTFNLLAGEKAPVYPTFMGAFVYDTRLNKWGRYASNVDEGA